MKEVHNALEHWPKRALLITAATDFHLHGWRLVWSARHRCLVARLVAS